MQWWPFTSERSQVKVNVGSSCSAKTFLSVTQHHNPDSGRPASYLTFVRTPCAPWTCADSFSSSAAGPKMCVKDPHFRSSLWLFMFCGTRLHWPSIGTVMRKLLIWCSPMSLIYYASGQILMESATLLVCRSDTNPVQLIQPPQKTKKHKNTALE